MTALVVTGLGSRVVDAGEKVDAAAYLRERKSRKYLGVQDALAVVATGEALLQAQLLEEAKARGLGARTGLFLAVGYIPFLNRDIEPVLESSVDDAGNFSMQRFAAGGYQRAHPLLAFRCLPNMPAYHIAVNFDVQGPYYVSYPSAGQLYLALTEARLALAEGVIDRALVCGVAHQTNFLVQHHHQRLTPPTLPEQLRDAAATVVLERPASANKRGAKVLAKLSSLTTDYVPFDPCTTSPEPFDSGQNADAVSSRSGGPDAVFDAGLDTGPAGPLLALARALANLDAGGGEHAFSHTMRSRDGIVGHSEFVLLPEDTC